jgi:hypothetical protein
VLDWSRVRGGPAPDARAEAETREVHARLRSDRPYFPAPPLAPEQVAPHEDSALEGRGAWRGWGLRLMSPALWDRHVGSNVVLAYYYARRRSGWVEEAVGLAPIAMLAAASCWMYRRASKSATPLDAGWEVALGLAVLGALLLPAHAAFMAGWSVRRGLQALPLEELRLTRLKPADIVQGLAAGPLAVQSFGLVLLTMIDAMAMLWLALGSTRNPFTGLVSMGFYGLLVGVPRWRMTQMACEAAGGFAVRAQFCLQRWTWAGLRTAFDTAVHGVAIVALALLCLVPALALAALYPYVIMLVTPVNMFLGPPPPVFLPAQVPIVLALLLAFWPAMMILRGAAHEALSWTWEHPEEWWPLFEAEADSDDRQLRRTLFSPWKPLLGERRPWLAPATRGR